MRLPDNAEVSNELWDEVIECLKQRVGDKAPLIRTYAVRALSRFATDCENSDVLDLFLEVLHLEQNAVSVYLFKYLHVLMCEPLWKFNLILVLDYTQFFTDTITYLDVAVFNTIGLHCHVLLSYII